MNQKSDRMYYIDFLKFIGISCVILAHVSWKHWLSTVRSFDVPLMVILSAILVSQSYDRHVKRGEKPAKWCLDRTIRLAIPTWIFLFFLFVLYAVFGKTYSSQYYVKSFLLTRGGIGCVWVILVFIYGGISIPLIKKMGFDSNNAVAVIVPICIYMLYEITISIVIKYNIINLSDTGIYYVLPYFLLTYLGCNYRKMSQQQKQIVIALSIIMFLICAVLLHRSTGVFQRIETKKFPPMMYFISYGIFVSFILINVCEKEDRKLFHNRFIAFISRESMWIYLWHILALGIAHKMVGSVWWLKYLITYAMSITIVYFQRKIILCVGNKLHISDNKFFRLML